MKKVITTIIAAIILSAALCLPVYTEEAALTAPAPAETYAVWNGGSDTKWYTGGAHAGTAADPYVISTAAELSGLSDLVAGGTTFQGKRIVLENDLYFNNLPASDSSADILAWAAQPGKNVWRPIGDLNHKFSGVFDGQGHVLFGLYADGYSCAGLFGYTENATVRGVTVSRSYISSSAYAGSIVAYLYVLNESSAVEDCASYACIGSSLTPVYTGGIVGYACAYYGGVTVRNCKNYGDISISSRSSQNVAVGGVVGYARSLHNYGYTASFTVSGCENYGSVTNASPLHENVSTGGVVGSAEAKNTKLSVVSCKNRGVVNGKGFVGGVVGYLSATVSGTSSAYISNCYNVTEVRGDGYTGGLVGAMHSSLTTAMPQDPVVYVEESFNSGVVVGSGATGGIAGAMLCYGSNIAVRDCFGTGRVWSAFTGDTELSMAVFENSELYGGAGAAVGKIYAEAGVSNNVEISRVYVTGDCFERVASAPSGAVVGLCCGYGSSTVHVRSAFYRLTGLPAIGRTAGAPSIESSYRGVEAEAMRDADTYIGFDFNDVWTMPDGGDISTPVLRRLGYVKTVCGHEDSSWTVTVPATCTEGGVRVYSCEFCGELLDSEAIPATGHAPGDWMTRTEPTCTGDGERSRYCTVCGVELEKETIPAKGHTPSAWTTVRAPSCTEDGLDAVICLTCGTLLDARTVPATGHLFVQESVKEATYFEDGLIVSVCEHCGEKQETVIPMIICEHGETETKTVKEATCAETGLRTTVCLVCGRTLNEETIEKLPHGNEVVYHTVPATCTADGLDEIRCEKCGETLYTRVVSAKGHAPGDWEVSIAPTCLSGGEDVKLCTVCGDIMLIRQTSALGHRKGELVTVTAATCTAEGSGEYRCERCGELLEETVIPAAGHSPGEWKEIVPATCTGNGMKHKNCTVCGELVESEIIPATGHSPGGWEVTVPATCTESGVKEIRCTFCGETFESETVPATGHLPVTELTPPTCTADGSEKTVCSLCGEVTYEKVIKAKGHDFVVSDENENVRYCTICGAVETIDPSASTLTVVLILVGIVAVFAAACVVVIVRTNRKNRLDE